MDFFGMQYQMPRSSLGIYEWLPGCIWNNCRFLVCYIKRAIEMDTTNEAN